jgi:hypothetical protein
MTSGEHRVPGLVYTRMSRQFGEELWKDLDLVEALFRGRVQAAQELGREIYSDELVKVYIRYFSAVWANDVEAILPDIQRCLAFLGDVLPILPIHWQDLVQGMFVAGYGRKVMMPSTALIRLTNILADQFGCAHVNPESPFIVGSILAALGRVSFDWDARSEAAKAMLVDFGWTVIQFVKLAQPIQTDLEQAEYNTCHTTALTNKPFLVYSYLAELAERGLGLEENLTHDSLIAELTDQGLENNQWIGLPMLRAEFEREYIGLPDSIEADNLEEMVDGFLLFLFLARLLASPLLITEQVERVKQLYLQHEKSAYFSTRFLELGFSLNSDSLEA